MAITERETPVRSTGRGRRPSVDIATTKPGTPDGIFMRQFWHPDRPQRRRSPPGRAVPIRMMNEDYTLFRGDERSSAARRAECPHRGALMHLGWVEKTTISAACITVGSTIARANASKRRPRKRASSRTSRSGVFPTAEAFELIYGYFGPGEPPAFPPYPESRVRGSSRRGRRGASCRATTCSRSRTAWTKCTLRTCTAPGGSHAKLAMDLPIITAEETPWGMMRYGKRASGMVRHTLHIAPNIVRVIVPPLVRNGRRRRVAGDHVPLHADRRRKPPVVRDREGPRHGRRRGTVPGQAPRVL